MDPVYIVMGVSGSGKTTVGKKLATALQIPFYDADDFHPKSNIDKMKSGKPLNDKDRWPWLDILSLNIVKWKEEDGAVLACSALKEIYRERLFSNCKLASANSMRSEVEVAIPNLIFLQASFDTIKKRLEERRDHFFTSELLKSQFDILEEPEYGIKVNAGFEPLKVVEDILVALSSK